MSRDAACLFSAEGLSEFFGSSLTVAGGAFVSVAYRPPHRRASKAACRTFRAMRARAAGRFPPANVFIDDNAAIIELELPGKTANEVSLALEPQAVTVADKPAAEEGKEPRQPAWSRRLDLPFRVNADKANAKFTDGILRIELP